MNKGNGYFKESFLIGGLVLVGAFLLSMGFNHPRLHPLKPAVYTLLPALSLEEVKIVASAHVMNAEESKKAFGYDLPGKGICPVLVSVQNNTRDTYALSASSMDIPRVEASKVAFKITKSALPRLIAVKVASLFFWPLMIPSAIDSTYVSIHHNNIKRDFKAKSMRDETITPYSTLYRVLFVNKAQLQPQVKMTLIELETLQPTELQLSIDNNESIG